LRELEPAFQWLREHPEIRDVIVSGGDPLIASDNRIVSILRALAEIESVDHVRLATRAPVTLPQRIDESLARQLHEAHPALWIMTHFNHPKELTPEASRACATLVDHGLPVMNQSVLLRGVNDSRDTLVRLFRGLVKRRVRPYYLLQCDPVRGTGHLRTPLKRGLELMGQIQGHLSGIAVPKFIVDTPGGRGKVHLTPEAIVESAAGATTLRTFRDELVVYQDPPDTESRKSE
jgi:lysine 2,3-aminomutase